MRYKAAPSDSATKASATPSPSPPDHCTSPHPGAIPRKRAAVASLVPLAQSASASATVDVTGATLVGVITFPFVWAWVIDFTRLTVETASFSLETADPWISGYRHSGSAAVDGVAFGGGEQLASGPAGERSRRIDQVCPRTTIGEEHAGHVERAAAADIAAGGGPSWSIVKPPQQAEHGFGTGMRDDDAR